MIDYYHQRFALNFIRFSHFGHILSSLHSVYVFSEWPYFPSQSNSFNQLNKRILYIVKDINKIMEDRFMCNHSLIYYNGVYKVTLFSAILIALLWSVWVKRMKKVLHPRCHIFLINCSTKNITVLYFIFFWKNPRSY